jgi:solute:Na+ symporter, SSS family
MKNVGGWSGLVQRLNVVSQANGFPAGTYTSTWSHLGSAAANPMHVDAFSLVVGLGFVLSFGYWCTDFLVIQRAMASESMSAARRTPLLAAIPKMLFPVLVILPGMIAIALTYSAGKNGLQLPKAADGTFNYNMAIPVMLGHYFPPGVLGLGLTALMASFMSGMAGNVTAFNTIFTYDIYQSYIVKDKPDEHYLMVGRVITVLGIAVSILAAYAVTQFNDIMDILQLVFSFVNAPLFATFLLGMFWRRSTGHGAFYGLLAGTGAAVVYDGMTTTVGSHNWIKGGWLIHLHIHPYLFPIGGEMAQNFWMAIWAFGVCFGVTVMISILTRQKKSEDDLKGLVYSLTPKIKDHDLPWYKQPATLGVIVLAATVVLNIIFM